MNSLLSHCISFFFRWQFQYPHLSVKYFQRGLEKTSSTLKKKWWVQTHAVQKLSTDSTAVNNRPPSTPTYTQTQKTWKASVQTDEMYTHIRKWVNQTSHQEIINIRSTCDASKAHTLNEISWEERWWDFFFYGCLLIFHTLSRMLYVVPHLLIGCSLLLSMSGLGGGAEKVLKLSDRGREEGLEEGREACLRRSPSSIWWERGVKMMRHCY